MRMLVRNADSQALASLCGDRLGTQSLGESRGTTGFLYTESQVLGMKPRQRGPGQDIVPKCPRCAAGLQLHWSVSNGDNPTVCPLLGTVFQNARRWMLAATPCLTGTEDTEHQVVTSATAMGTE